MHRLHSLRSAGSCHCVLLHTAIGLTAPYLEFLHVGVSAWIGACWNTAWVYACLSRFTLHWVWVSALPLDHLGWVWRFLGLDFYWNSLFLYHTDLSLHPPLWILGLHCTALLLSCLSCTTFLDSPHVPAPLSPGILLSLSFLTCFCRFSLSGFLLWTLQFPGFSSAFSLSLSFSLCLGPLGGLSTALSFFLFLLSLLRFAAVWIFVFYGSLPPPFFLFHCTAVLSLGCLRFLLPLLYQVTGSSASHFLTARFFLSFLSSVSPAHTHLLTVSTSLLPLFSLLSRRFSASFLCHSFHTIFSAQMGTPHWVYSHSFLCVLCHIPACNFSVLRRSAFSFPARFSFSGCSRFALGLTVGFYHSTCSLCSLYILGTLSCTFLGCIWVQIFLFLYLLSHSPALLFSSLPGRAGMDI